MSKNKIGMYGETQIVKVGKYNICRQDPDGKNKSVWIENNDGIGGEFSDIIFESAMDVFFKENI
jgi:hypothetical protein